MGPLRNYEQLISSSTLRYTPGTVMLLSTGFLTNNSGSPVVIERVSPVWERGCTVATASPGELFNGNNGTGWSVQADLPIARAGFGRKYELPLRLRPRWGGGWFVSFNLRIPNACIARTAGFDVTYRSNEKMNVQFLPEDARFIPQHESRPAGYNDR